MISRITILLLFAFSISTFAGLKTQTDVLQNKDVLNTSVEQVYKQPATVFSGDFPGGIIWREIFDRPASFGKWASKDNTDPRPEPSPSEWIINDWQAYDGLAWRCANLAFGDNGGYDNHWYQVLDTPPLLLDEDAMFTFYHRYSCEDPTGASGGYDAWDGLNVRISTDGGSSWEVLPAGTYNVSSIWAFGHPDQGHNEGPGIAGWAGTMDTWTMESFDLSAYTSSSIMLRFAFASDMAYSTADGAPALYGWQIDNIEVKSATKTFFSNDGADQDLVGKSNEFIPPLGGDLWNIVKIQEPIPAIAPEFTPVGLYDNYALSCQNSTYFFDEDATYNPYMDNAAFTGPISIPEVSPIYLDYKYVPFFFDADAFPNVEYFRPEVSLDGVNWEYIEAQPYVYSFGYNMWLEFSWLYGYPPNMTMFDLTRFAGQDIYLSFRFWSDYDTPVGYGLLVDDIVIYNPARFVPAPQNLTAEPNFDLEQIELQWDAQHETSIYTIWRRTQGDTKFSSIAELIGENEYADTEALPYFNYEYMVTSVMKYTGSSAPSDTVLAGIIPQGVIELAYDDGESDSSIIATVNKQIAVMFTPDTYPAYFEAVKIMLDKTEATSFAAQIAIFDDDGPNDVPGTRLTRLNRTGLLDGYNIFTFDPPVTISDGSFYVAYKRYGEGLSVAVDTDAPIDGRTYIENDTSWEQQLGYDAIMHAFLDTSATSKVDFVSGIRNPDQAVNPTEFTLLKNYPNPFNPSTTLQFYAPQNLVSNRVHLDIYNLLGEKVKSLFSGTVAEGLKNVTWNGSNDGGHYVNSGIYLVRLQSGQHTLTQRILLLK